LQSEDLHILYSPQILSGRSSQGEWGGQDMWHAWERNVYKVLMGKREGKRPLGRPRRRWEDGIRMDLRKIGWESVEWIQLAQDRDRWRAIVNTVINFRVLAPWRLCCSVQTIAGIASLTRCHTCTSYTSATVKNLAVFLTYNSCLRTSSYHWRYTCISEHYQPTLLTYIDLYDVKNIFVTHSWTDLWRGAWWKPIETKFVNSESRIAE
jgi:hypothetical protein